MPKQCPNPQCRKPDNPDNATLCYKCGTALHRNMALPGPAGGTVRPTSTRFGPRVYCQLAANGNSVTLTGAIERIVRDPVFVKGPGFSTRMFALGIIVIRILTLLGLLITVIVTAVNWGRSILWAVIYLLVGLVVTIISHKFAAFFWEKFCFLRISLQSPGRMGPSVNTRVLQVRDLATQQSIDAELSSSHPSELMMPKTGDKIELDGIRRGGRIAVKSYRLAGGQ